MIRFSTAALALLLALSLAAAPVHAQIYVDTDATGANDGTSWTDAYTDLQTAIDNATSSSEIWIAQGIYKPDSEGDSFTITGNIDGVEVYGGFEGNESARSARKPKTQRTILSGDLNGDDTDPDGDGIIEDADPNQDGTPENLNGGENAHHVFVLNGGGAIGADVSANITSATVLDGLVVTAGQADGSNLLEVNGGGVFCDGSSSGNACSPTLSNLIFAGNAADDWGGAIYNFGRFSGTTSPEITNATFTGNATSDGGGAIFNDGQSAGTASPEITNATFTGNATDFHGGAIYNNGDAGTSSPQITNATFTGNATDLGGGAIYNDGLQGTASPRIANAILWGNTAGSSGAEISNNSTDNDPPVLTHTIIEGGVNGSGVGGRSNTDGGGNLDRDPQFADASTPAGPDGVFGTRDDGLNVLDTSPALDAGDNAEIPSGVTEDITGDDRTQDIDGDGTATVNIGAYEKSRGFPTAQTGPASNVSGTSADLAGTVNPRDFETTVQAQVYPASDPSAVQGFTDADSPLTGDTDQSITVSLTGLAPDTEYKARIVASNSKGSDTGNEITFTTASSAPPSATTEAPSSVGATTAGLAGTVNPNGAETDVSFRIREAATGATFAVVEADESPLTGTSDQAVSTSGSFDPDTEYEVQVEASNSEGSDSGQFVSFTTDPIGVALTGGGFGGLDRTFSATPGEADQPVGVFRLTPGQSGVDLTKVVVTPDVTDASGVDRMGLWVSSDASFEPSGDTELAGLDLDPSTALPSPLTFGSLGKALPGSARYLFVTATLTGDAEGEVTGFLDDETALALGGGTIAEVNGNTGQDQFSNLPLSREATALPVEMAGFEGTLVEDGAQLQWQTASETNNAGFRVERTGEGANGGEGEWTEVGFVEGSGTTSQAQRYRFTDDDLPYAADTLRYRLTQVDTDGTTHRTDPVTIARSGPGGLRLLGTAPNPARRQATVRYAVPEEESGERTVEMRLYDTLGRRVRTVEARAEAGRHEQRLDLGGLSSGMYFLRLQAGGQVKTRKLTVVQ